MIYIIKRTICAIEILLSLQPFKRGCGGIGIRARLRIWCLTAYGFESLHPHQSENRESAEKQNREEKQ